MTSTLTSNVKNVRIQCKYTYFQVRKKTSTIANIAEEKLKI